MMKKPSYRLLGPAVAFALLAMTGCASQSDLDALRQEVSKSQEMARASAARAIS